MKMKSISLLFNRRNFILKTSFLIFFLIIQYSLFAQKVITLSDSSIPLNIGKNLEILLDLKAIHDSSDILSQKDFEITNKTVPVFTLPVNSLWLRFGLKNFSRQNDLYCSIKYSNISDILFYEKDSSNKLVLLRHTGNSQDFATRGNKNVDFNFLLNIPYEQKKVIM